MQFCRDKKNQLCSDKNQTPRPCSTDKYLQPQKSRREVLTQQVVFAVARRAADSLRPKREAVMSLQTRIRLLQVQKRGCRCKLNVCSCNGPSSWNMYCERQLICSFNPLTASETTTDADKLDVKALYSVLVVWLQVVLAVKIHLSLC